MKNYIVSIIAFVAVVVSVHAQSPVPTGSPIDPDCSICEDDIRDFEDPGGGNTTPGRCMYRDLDGDGYGSGSVVCVNSSNTTGYSYNNQDCDDSSASIKPRTWYMDADGDGVGNSSRPALHCSSTAARDGWSLIKGDCDDNDPAITGERVWYENLDGDAFGNSLVTKIECFQPSGYIAQGGDCNDNDASIGQVLLYEDQDGDGLGDPNSIYRNGYISNPPVCERAGWVTNADDNCPLNYGTAANSGCPVGDAYILEARNTVYEKTYRVDSSVVATSKIYYNTLGKQEQSLSYDSKTGKTWASQTLYDAQGRVGMQTLAAPAYPGETLVYKNGFVKKEGGAELNADDINNQDVNNSVEINDEAYTLGGYYANPANNLEDKTTRPYSKTIYSDLMPGTAKQTIGGNKQNGEWRQGYSFSMPAAQEMYYVFGYDHFLSHDEEQNNVYALEHYGEFFPSVNIKLAWEKVGKTVVRDVQGNENVVFTDVQGRTIAAARSGGAKQYEVLSLIGEQKYVDIHIPEGCENTAQLLGNSSDYKIYNLKTETDDGDISKPGFYRVEYIGDNVEFTEGGELTYIDLSSKQIHPVENLFDSSDAIGVRYKVNYYDYSLNYYNEAGQLTSTLQPLGFNDTCLDNLSATVNHEEKLKSEFKYNALGQLEHTKSPDEGHAWFVYREDGQIRFSTNSKQWENKEISYTDYDALARPIESGVYHDVPLAFLKNFPGVDNITMETNPFKNTIQNHIEVNQTDIPNTTRKEQHFSVYDRINIEDKNWLTTKAGNAYANPSFLSGNIAKTYNIEDGNVYARTYYSYDVYGRVKWIVQGIASLANNGAKTIDYEYDPVTSQVTKVIYQKNNAQEKFIHRYTYDTIDQSLKKVEISTDDINFTEQAVYDYYETGALRRTTLAGGIQEIDYVYNLNGQLKSINHPSLAQDNELNPFERDLFGVSLDYYTGDYQRSTQFSFPTPNSFNQYNGNIKAMTWGTKKRANETASPVQYKYEYNENNWLKNATFDGLGSAPISAAADVVIDYMITNSQDVKATNSIVFKPNFSVKADANLSFSAKIVDATTGEYQQGDYNISGVSQDANGNIVNGISYDANGNIKSLIRNKNTEDNSNKMDELTYTYKEGLSNRLDYVKDDAGKTTLNDIDTQAPDNYQYNAIGQLVKNNAEKIEYEYNASGLVTKVKYDDKVRVEFKYNDKNFRTEKISYKANGTTIDKRTHYILDASGGTLAIYEDEMLKEIPIYGANRLGVYNKETGTSVYQLTDHLGNVRAVIAKNGDAAIAVSKTDYYPFGMAMPNRSEGENTYRYAYQGQEKDPETGKEAFQLRLWDARIGRWLTIDPKREFASPYLGMGNNPVRLTDPDGGSTEDNCCGGEYDMKHPGVDLGVIKGVKSSTGYIPNGRDWEILEMLRNSAPNIYASINRSYKSGDFFQLGGGNWGGFSSQFQQGWEGRNNYPNTGVAEFWSNTASVSIIGTMTLAVGSSIGITTIGKSMFLGGGGATTPTIAPPQLTTTVYRNFGWNELSSLKLNNGNFTIMENGFGAKQFWLNEKSLNWWKASSFSKPFTAKISVEVNALKHGHYFKDYGQYEAVSFDSQSALNIFNQSMKIEWISYY